MKRATLLSMLLVAGLVGCNVPPPKSPVPDTEVPGVESADPEPSGLEAGEAEATEAKTGEPKAPEPKAVEPEPSPAPTAEPAEEVPCKKLKKGLCKATRGCAWRDPPSPGCIEASDMADVSGDD